MRDLGKRVAKLETASGDGLQSVALWTPFEDFVPPDDSGDNRLLIELVFLGSDKMPETLTPEQQASRARAYAWADGQ